MGGAGTWHLGLHFPDNWCVMGPGAGFTSTHGYIKGLPKLPDYQEACLKIYDAVEYAENAFNVPIVAYSGGADPQKAAAVLQFYDWAYKNGDSMAGQLDYVPMPAAVKTLIRKQWVANIHGPDNKPVYVSR